MQSINMNKKGRGFSKVFVLIKIQLAGESITFIKLCISNLSICQIYSCRRITNILILFLYGEHRTLIKLQDFLNYLDINE